MPIGIKAILGLLIVLLIGLCGARVQAWRDNQAMETLKAQYASEKQAIADATTKQMQQAAAREHTLHGQLAVNDANHYRELHNAQIQLDALRARLNRGTQRMFVRVQAPADCGHVSDHSAGTGMGDGETYAQLDPTTASSLAGLAAEGDAAIIQLKWFQDREPLIQQALQSSQ